MYRRWKEFCRLWRELGVLDLLRKHVPSERLYLVDRLVWVMGVIDWGGEDEDDNYLVNDSE
jgi:hypothetical protein